MIPSSEQTLTISAHDSSGKEWNAAFSVRNDEKFAVVIKRAEQITAEVSKCSCVFLEEEIFKDGDEERTAVICRDPETQDSCSLFPEDGSEPDGPPLRCILRVPLLSSVVPSFSRITPELKVELRLEVFHMTELRELEETSLEALREERFAFLLRGIRCGSRFFWQGYHYGYFDIFIDAESGDKFSREDLPATQCFVLALMKNGSPVPRCSKNRFGFLLQVWSRSSVQEVSQGRVRTLGAVSQDIERWNFAFNDFGRDITEAAAE